MNRDDINKLIQEHGLFHGTMALGVVMDAEHLERFAKLVAAAEREECAKVCETYNKRQSYNDEDMVVANECAFAIRERGAP
jgi:hypothetical protein